MFNSNSEKQVNNYDEMKISTAYLWNQSTKQFLISFNYKNGVEFG